MSKLTGIIGWPVATSLSPVMHNAAFADLELDWSYIAVAIRPGSLDEGMGQIDTLGMDGLNVTMPHKVDILTYCTSVSDTVERIGAANTLVRTPEGWDAHNTDGQGFINFLQSETKTLPKKVLILGAGGAARAVAVALADLGTEVVVTARRAEAAQTIARLADGIESVEWGRRVASDAVINATPISDDSMPAAYMRFPKGRLAIDLVYGKSTAFLEAAKESGVPHFDGLGMLVHQALLSFSIWTGLEASKSVMRDAAEEALRQAQRD